MWLEVSSVSWCSDYQARVAPTSVTAPPSEVRPVLAHTLNGSALAWPRIWAALIECGRTSRRDRRPPCGPRALSRHPDHRPAQVLNPASRPRREAGQEDVVRVGSLWVALTAEPLEGLVTCRSHDGARSPSRAS